MTAHAAPTNPNPSTPIDARTVLDRALRTSAGVVAGVRPDQLSAPTPCTEMDVRTLLAHLVGVLDRIAAMGDGRDPFTVTEQPAADDRWEDAWGEAATRATNAWNDDNVLERDMALPWIQGTGAEILVSYCSELTVHTWDLAMATGARAAWDDDVLDALVAARPILPADDRRAMFEEVSAAMGLDEPAIPFADAVPVADSASTIDRLVAWHGRDPRRPIGV